MVVFGHTVLWRTEMKRKKRSLSLLICIAMIASLLFSGTTSFVAAETADSVSDSGKARLEMKLSVSETQELEAKETFTAEIWLYNVENVKSGTINLKGQNYIFGNSGAAATATDLNEAITWGDLVDQESSSFGYNGVPIMAADALEVSFREPVRTDSQGILVATVTLALPEKGSVDITFGGWGLRGSNVPACYWKDAEGADVYRSQDGMIDTACTYDAAETPEPEPTTDPGWPSFRGNDQNMGITSAATPTSSGSTALKWACKGGTGYAAGAGPGVIVGDYLYSVSASGLLRINKDTGTVRYGDPVETTMLFNTVSPAYGVINQDKENEQGLIFAPISGGVQAFDAKTLETKWTYTAKSQRQNQCPVIYDSETEYGYTGHWAGNYLCLDAKTGDLVWELEYAPGFYWAGGVIVGDLLIFGGDAEDADAGDESGEGSKATLHCVNKKTGEAVGRQLQIEGNQRSTISYDTETEKVYFTTKPGYLYSAKVTTDGLTGLKAKDYREIGNATGTPVVYKGRVYVGLGTLNAENNKVLVADADTLEPIYQVPMNGYPQGSGLLSTAYEDEQDGTVYLYFTYNNPPGGITLIRDKAGQTEPDYEELYYPESGKKEYCLSSIICDSAGDLYFLNDSGYLMGLTRTEAWLQDLTIEDNNGKPVELKKESYNDRGFFPGFEEYEALADRSASEVAISFHAVEGATVTVDGTEAKDIHRVPVSGEAKPVKLTVKKGGSERTYTISLRKYRDDASLKVLKCSRYASDDSNLNRPGSEAIWAPVTPDFTADNNAYEANVTWDHSTCEFFFVPGDENANVTEVTVQEKKLELRYFQYSYNEQGEWDPFLSGTRVSLKKGDVPSGEPVDINVTVTAEDQKTTKTYTITLNWDYTPPQITDVKLQRISEDKALLSFDSDEAGELRYIYSKDGSGESIGISDWEGPLAIRKGSNSLELTGLSGMEELIFCVWDYAVPETYAAPRTEFIRSAIPATETEPAKPDPGQTGGTEDASAVLKAFKAKTPVVSLKNQTRTSIKVSWKKVKDADGYAIYRSTKKNKGYKKVKTINSGRKLSWIDKKKKTGSKYYYKVRAWQKDGTGTAWTKSSKAKGLTAKVQAPSVKYKTRDGVVRASWKKVTGADRYQIYRATKQKGRYKKIATTKKRTFRDTKVRKGRAYYYKVRAVDKVKGKTLHSSFSKTKKIKAR